MKMTAKIGMMAYALACAAMPCLAQEEEGGEYGWPPPTGIARGVVNIVTSPGEIFRDMSYYGGCGYENAAEPGAVVGGIFGIVPGSVMCVARLADGVLDCFTLGIWRNAVYQSEHARDFFPTFVWDDRWLPESLRQE